MHWVSGKEVEARQASSFGSCCFMVTGTVGRGTRGWQPPLIPLPVVSIPLMSGTRGSVFWNILPLRVNISIPSSVVIRITCFCCEQAGIRTRDFYQKGPGDSYLHETLRQYCLEQGKYSRSLDCSLTSSFDSPVLGLPLP